MAKHRTHSIAFKQQVVGEYLGGDTIHGLAKRHDLSRNLIRIWVQKYEAGVLDQDAAAAEMMQEYEARIAALERLVGKQALELEFLKGSSKRTATEKRAYVPTAPTVVANANTVTHDETAGVQVAGDPNASNDVAGSTATIFDGVADTESGVFAGVANKGSDADVTAKDTGAIGFATNASSLVTVSGGSFGADGAAASGATSYALNVTNDISGLSTTSGQAITLTLESGIVVGRVVGGADAGKAAFAIAIDPQTGQVHVAQYLSLQHPTGGSSYDEPIQLATNTLQVVVSLKDGDGDTVSATGADVSGQIRFQDDGPTAPTVV